VVHPTEPCALRSTQPLKVSTREFSWGKGGRCVWLRNYHPRSAETSRKSGALIYPEPLGQPRPVAGHLYFTLPPFVIKCYKIHVFYNILSSSVGATTPGGFWPALRFCSTIFYLYTSLSNFSLSSSLNPLLLGQAISVLDFLLVLMNMVPIQ